MLDTGTLTGRLSATGGLTGRLTTSSSITGTITRFDGDYPPYTGTYEVAPTDEEQILDTTNRYMTGQVVVSPVPGDYVGQDVPRRGPGDMYSAGAFVYAPAGYYPNLAAQSVDISTSLPKPSISVSETGMITATESITDSAFFQRGLSAERTKQLTQQRGKTVTPSTVEQVVVPAGRYTTGEVKVAPIPSNYGLVTWDGSRLTIS